MSNSSNPSSPHRTFGKFFSLTEAALIFNVNKQDIRAWIKAGTLRAYQFGEGDHAIRIRRQDLDALIIAIQKGEFQPAEIRNSHHNPSLQGRQTP